MNRYYVKSIIIVFIFSTLYNILNRFLDYNESLWVSYTIHIILFLICFLICWIFSGFTFERAKNNSITLYIVISAIMLLSLISRIYLKSKGVS